ncbi:hypothetical protein E1B28_012799 [Marasmius oreades]|uniref:Uncharacterized protein n=1 Tax=Marasmius oreades TaxID=181124 RepID=A0A9P7RSC5_9AGAR|nr:uncharacterized protein E1B28_012799 [Marasmius oreades]KAG7088844.1 hypothetical protein E1B28_012799 [Marasmius oreades]
MVEDWLRSNNGSVPRDPQLGLALSRGSYQYHGAIFFIFNTHDGTALPTSTTYTEQNSIVLELVAIPHSARGLSRFFLFHGSAIELEEYVLQAFKFLDCQIQRSRALRLGLRYPLRF